MLKISFIDKDLHIEFDCELISKIENTTNFSIDFKFKTSQMTSIEYRKELIATAKEMKIVDVWYDVYEILLCDMEIHSNYAIISVSVINPEYRHLVTGDAEENTDE